MPSPKALILQGILGVAGLCASSAAGIGLSLDKAFGGVQSDAVGDDSADKPEINPQNIEVVKEEDLGIPKECDTSCSLTAEQLKKLKFKKKGDDEIKYEGLEDSDEFELIVEVTEDLTNYPKGKKYILRPKTIAGTVTIQNIKEGDIVLGKDQEVIIREVIGGGELEHLLEEVNGLGIPKRCESDQVEGETKTCELTKLQLQKLKFEARRGEEVKAQGLNEGNIVTLKIEDKSNDRNNYPHGKKYTLSSNGYVVITGEKGGNIVLENGEEVLIRETSSGGKLEHLLEELNELGIPNRCIGEGAKKPCDLKQRQLKDLKFEAKEGSSITVEGKNEDSKFTLEIEDKSNDQNYPRGKKYTLSSTGTKATIKNIKDGDTVVWENQSVVIRETKEGGKLEMAPEEIDDLGIPRECKRSCSLTEEQLKKLQFETRGNEEIKVEGLDAGYKVTLKVEDRKNDTDNYPRGKKYTLSAKETVIIKGINGGDITLGKRGDVVIREKIGGGKLEIAPEEIDNLGIPKRCNTGATCQLTKEQFEKLKFEANGASSISIDGLNDGNTVDLKVKTENNLIHYPKKKKYTFTSKAGTVTIRGAKDKDIVLEQNKDVVFREIKGGDKLETYLDVLGIPRGWEAEDIKRGSDPKTYCLSSDQLKDLQFENFSEKTGEVKVEGLERGEKIELKISWDGDKGKYPDNRKFSFDNTSKNVDIKISKGDQEITIRKNKETWFGNKGGKLELVDVKDKGQIAKEKKIGEKNEILQELGLGNLKIGNFVDGSSTRHSQTYISISNTNDLKKIQFKDFGGGAEGTTSFRPGSYQKIMVYLEWDDDAKKFPKNMKFLFENQYFTTGFDFWKGTKTIKIYEKDSKTMNTRNTFKVENLGDKWYLVRVNN